MTNVTKLEAKVLNAIAYAEMSTANGRTPQTIDETGTYLWVDEIAGEIDETIPRTKGAIGSLTAKKLITVRFWDKNDNVVDFTAAGFAAWQAVDERLEKTI